MVIIGGLVAITILALKFSILIVREQEAMVIERFGRFNRILNSGLHFIVPFIDQPRVMQWVRNGMIQNVDRIDLRELIIDIQEQSVITKDNVRVVIDAVVFLQINDLQRAIYNVQSLPYAVSQLTQTSLRSLAGEMDLDESLSSRERINLALRKVLDQAADKWGLEIKRVELRDIKPPEDVQHAMEKQMQAERERRASVLEAEGEKQSAILRAEGQRQAMIAQAEGEKQSRILKAQGEAESIERVAQARAEALKLLQIQIGEQATSYQITSSYLETFAHLIQKNDKVVMMPYEASKFLGALGGVKTIWEEGSKSVNTSE